jgi:hypothetical protein
MRACNSLHASGQRQILAHYKPSDMQALAKATLKNKPHFAKTRVTESVSTTEVWRTGYALCVVFGPRKEIYGNKAAPTASCKLDIDKGMNSV